jgi:hypothetical protein
LAEELEPVFAEVPADDDRFDLAISAGVQPRLWIDAVSHITLGRDRRTYRFLRDTRLGRVVLAESADMKKVADQVTRYIAERIVERNRVIEGDVAQIGRTEAIAEPAHSSPPSESGSAFVRGLSMVLLGGLVGLVIMLLIAWGLTELGYGF